MRYKLSDKMNQRLIYSEIYKDTYIIVGSEIRSRRIRLNLTLEGLADGICSLSYLCKIETSKIEPNMEFLRELCARLELSSSQLDTLMNLREVLIECVSAYLNNDIDTIDKYYELGSDLDNYRFSIIKLIYYISHKQLEYANMIYIELLKIAETMREFDFIIFSLFSAYLHYYNYRFDEALEILKALGNYNLSQDEEILRYICLFEASYSSNKIEVLNHYNKLKELLVETGNVNKIDYIRYILCLYYIKNDSDFYVKNELKAIKDIKYKNTIELFSNFKNKDVSGIINYDDDMLTDYAKMIKYYVTDIDKYKEMHERYDLDYHIIDYDYNFLNVLYYKLSDSYMKELFNVIIPRISNSDDNYIKKLVFNEIATNPILGNKNRNILRAYYLLFGNNIETSLLGGDYE